MLSIDPYAKLLILGAARLECILELDHEDYEPGWTLRCWDAQLAELAAGRGPVVLLPFNFSDQCTGWLRVGPLRDGLVEVRAGWSGVSQYSLQPADLLNPGLRIHDFTPMPGAGAVLPLADVIAVARQPVFATDLYQGTADFYDRFRPRYPQALIDDLVDRVRPGKGAYLLDLARGPGSLAFGLAPHFGLVLAVDQEPDMVQFVNAKAGGSGKVRAYRSAAEDLSVDPASLELITIGNAFHRLRREVVGRLAYRWLAPGGHLAVCWSSSPWTGNDDWRAALRGVLERWRRELGAEDRTPSNWGDARQARPDRVVLAEAGFEPLGVSEFRVSHDWTPASMAGFLYSTSFLARPVVGELAPEFEADLAAALPAHFVDEISFVHDLYRRPS